MSKKVNTSSRSNIYTPNYPPSWAVNDKTYNHILNNQQAHGAAREHHANNERSQLRLVKEIATLRNTIQQNLDADFRTVNYPDVNAKRRAALRKHEADLEKLLKVLTDVEKRLTEGPTGYIRRSKNSMKRK
jgi:hypothetical protein